MCSNAGGGGEPVTDVGDRLSQAIDELAAAVQTGDLLTGNELAAKLANAWALVTAADPELARRTARYQA